MRLAVSLLAVSALVLAAGCAKKDEHTVTADLHNADQQVSNAAQAVSHNPQVHEVETDLRNAAHDAGHDLHKAETEARDAVHSLGNDVHHAAHNATDHDAPDRSDNATSDHSHG
jgi:hypothetical protein